MKYETIEMNSDLIGFSERAVEVKQPLSEVIGGVLIFLLASAFVGCLVGLLITVKYK